VFWKTNLNVKMKPKVMHSTCVEYKPTFIQRINSSLQRSVHVTWTILYWLLSAFHFLESECLLDTNNLFRSWAQTITRLYLLGFNNYTVNCRRCLKTVECRTVQPTAQTVCQKYAKFHVGRSVLSLKTIDDT